MCKFNLKGKNIVAISDTHGYHRELKLPPSDILIHLGDACQDGDQEQLEDFFMWFSQQPAQYKIFLYGNHDLPFEFYPDMAEKLIPSNVIHLQNSIIEIEGIVIAGIKAVPYMLCDIEIDERVDILISHGAPKGVLDDGLGCDKLKKLITKTMPQYALFGHIHQRGSGYTEIENIKYCNVSTKL